MCSFFKWVLNTDFRCFVACLNMSGSMNNAWNIYNFIICVVNWAGSCWRISLHRMRCAIKWQIMQTQAKLYGCNKAFSYFHILVRCDPPHLFGGCWPSTPQQVVGLVWGTPTFQQVRVTHSAKTIIQCIYLNFFELVHFMGSKCWYICWQAAKLWSGRHNWRVIWNASVMQCISQLPQISLTSKHTCFNATGKQCLEEVMAICLIAPILFLTCQWPWTFFGSKSKC